VKKSATDERKKMRYEELTLQGRNAVMEAFRAGKPIDRLFILDGCKDGPVQSIIREAKKGDTILTFVKKERLDEISPDGKHQGVIAYAAAYEYAEVSDILKAASDKGEPPFIVILDGIEDPHNLGAIIRTAEAAGAHGVIIPKRRSASLNATVFKTSAGAASWLPVARVSNLAATIDMLKENGVWIYGTDGEGQSYTEVKLTGSLGLIVGSEGFGMGRLIKDKCDFLLSLPMAGKVNSLNASVAAGIFMYEAVRQRNL
jgi:23S rRNA (guanosine2251-2'-O)-methyltransferase